jgi:hypothetical protein
MLLIRFVEIIIFHYVLWGLAPAIAASLDVISIENLFTADFS